MLVYIVATMTLSTQGFEHNLYNFGGSPGVPLSDMNGMGRFWIGRSWFHLYWSAFALLMLVAAHLMWRRGVATFGQRLKKIPARITGSVAWITGVAALLWIGTGAFVFYNTNRLNEYQTQPEIEEWTANYEKTLLQYEKSPQPRIVDVKLAVNIEPKAVRVSTSGSYLVENRTGAPLNDVHVRWMTPLKMESLEVEGATLSKEFADYDYRIYSFSQPMQPGEKRTIRFNTVLEQRGFSNSRNRTNIVENGTFVNNMDIAPFLGMSRNAVLQDRSKRRKYGLPPELRPAKLEDETANGNHYLRNDSDWVTAELQVTTDADQTPIAPGYKVSDTVNGNRRTLITRTDAPIMHFFSMQSARYAEKADQWVNKDGSTVELSVYFHPQHQHNVQRMLDAMKISIDLFSEKFTPYQFKQARILEFPAYEDFAQAFANTMPYSEGIGFIKTTRKQKATNKLIW